MLEPPRSSSPEPEGPSPSARKAPLRVEKHLVWNIYGIYTSLFQTLQTLKVHFRTIARTFLGGRGAPGGLMHAENRRKGKKQHSRVKVEGVACDHRGTCARLRGRSPEEVKGQQETG